MLDFTSDGRFVTRTFERELAVELRLPSLEMQFRERGRPVPHLFNPEERSPAEAEAWILVELLHRGLERDKFSKSLPYTIANLLSGDAEDYSPQACALGLDELTAWLRTAAAVLSSDGRVVCLPETLTLLAPEPRRGAAVGFSPGDAGQGEPYFFVDTGLKRWLLTASDLANEKDVAAVAARLIVEASAVRRA
ncbi:MAG TPA: hypothetical protein VFB45_19525 [Pseudolabrys sp.]|nr:hypothetical protein [Pseudolabrys sp.]